MPYNGDTPGIAVLIGGTIQGFAAPVTAFIPSIQAGKMRALAVTSRARRPPEHTGRLMATDAAKWKRVIILDAGTGSPSRRCFGARQNDESSWRGINKSISMR